MTERDKVTVNDIIGLVDCEPTNSVEEVKKLRGRENKTEKRFTYMIDRVFDLWAVYDNKEKVICLVRNTDAKDLCDLLNELHEKNNELRLQLNLCSDQRNEFHRGARENANRVGKLEKENEQLKSKNRGLQSELQIFKEDVTHSNLQINKLADENEQLKLISNHRGEMVSFATSLIQDMGSEEMLKMWNDFTEVMYQKWKKKRGIK